MKLDKAAFEKLDLFPRLSQLVTDSGFTDEELKDKELFSAEDLSDQSIVRVFATPADRGLSYLLAEGCLTFPESLGKCLAGNHSASA